MSVYIPSDWARFFGADPAQFVVGVVRQGQHHFRTLNNRMVARTGKKSWPFTDKNGRRHEMDMESRSGESPIATALKTVTWARVVPSILLDEAKRYAYGYGSGKSLEGDGFDDLYNPTDGADFEGPPAPEGSIVVDDSTIVPPPAADAGDGQARQAMMEGALKIIVQLAPTVFELLASMAKGLMAPPPASPNPTGSDDKTSDEGSNVLPLALGVAALGLIFFG